MVLRTFVIGWVFLFCSQVFAQVRIIQWPDVHSQLKEIAWLTQNVDQIGREFLAKNPHGEVVIAVLGDYTSNGPDTRAEQGWLSLKALRFLRQRGYTVIYVPGNHDAFDWKYEANGVDLFIEQVRALNKWGVKVLAANMQQLSGDLNGLVGEHYDLRGTKVKSRFYGMTLQNLVAKSNLDHDSSKRLFGRLEPYSDTWQRMLLASQSDGVKNIIVGVHDAFYRLRDQRNHLHNVITRTNKEVGDSEKFNFSIPLMMSAHDHMTATTIQRGTLISGAGSYGSFSVFDLTREGTLQVDSVKHYVVTNAFGRNSQKAELEVGEIKFQYREFSEEIRHQGLIDLNQWIQRYLTEIHTDRQQVERLLSELDADKSIRGGRHLLGRIFSEALLNWVKDRHWYRISEHTNVVAIVDPASHDISAPFERMTADKNAMVFSATGAELARLYNSFKRLRNRDGSPTYQPQFNRGVRTADNEIEVINLRGQWRRLEAHEKVLVVIDSWLVSERYRRENAISEQVFLSQVNRLDRAPYLSILMEFLPEVLADFGVKASVHRPRIYSCEIVFGAP